MITVTPGNELTFEKSDIMYFGEHRCPECNAIGSINGGNQVFTPMLTFYSYPTLTAWNDYGGYLHFLCQNTCYNGKEPIYAMGRNTNPMTSIRVARLGQAMIPLPLILYSEERSYRFKGMDTAFLDAQRVQQAILFLSNNAEPDKLNIDFVTAQILLASSGKLTPDQAKENIAAWDGS